MPESGTLPLFNEIRARSLEAERKWNPPSLLSIPQLEEMRGQTVLRKRPRQPNPPETHRTGAG